MQHFLFQTKSNHLMIRSKSSSSVAEKVVKNNLSFTLSEQNQKQNVTLTF